MYVGLVLAYLGEAGILGQVWPMFLLPLTVAYMNWVVIPVEEGKLKEVFGEAYERYRARVRRWM
jgi:protein-S-isoprenylcysteine O-methyltransferase Ste14